MYTLNSHTAPGQLQHYDISFNTCTLISLKYTSWGFQWS